MALKVANTVAITDELKGQFSNTTFLNGSYLVMPEDPAAEYQFQGTISGYAAGGRNPFSGPPTNINTIQKFSFANESDGTDVGNLTALKRYAAGASSSAHGYAAGGEVPPGPPSGYVTVIDKFPFAVDTNSSDSGDISAARRIGAGSSSDVNGYSSGGDEGFNVNTIERYPFGSDNNVTDVGDLTQTLNGGCGLSSVTAGFVAGGFPPFRTTIDKFPFASDTNAGIHGDLTVGKYQAGDASSETSGYVMGGLESTPLFADRIEKFSFASDSDGADIGDLSSGKAYMSGQSSTTSGYSSGGSPPGTNLDTIDKFPFASDTNATNVARLVEITAGSSGHQR